MSTPRPWTAAWAALLLVPLLACGGERPAAATRMEPAASRGQALEPAPEAPPAATAEAGLPPMMPGRIHAPTVGEVSCPSLDFGGFIRAFFNSGDLQVRFTAKPYELKGPYYEQHNTQPGDPANPQWAVVDVERPLHGLYRYDPHLHAFVLDTSRLRPGQRWTGVDIDERRIQNPVVELDIRKVSDTEYAIDTPGRITTFNQRGDCWYLTHDWTLDPAEGCAWPDGCRAWREFEAPYYEGE